MRPPERLLLAAHATYLVVTGGWPLVHYRSFEAILGRKRDDWLVKTLALFLLPVAVAEACASARNRITAEVRATAIGSSLVLGGTSAWYSLRGQIRRTYLADTAIEAVLVLGLVLARRRRIPRDDPARS